MIKSELNFEKGAQPSIFRWFVEIQTHKIVWKILSLSKKRLPYKILMFRKWVRLITFHHSVIPGRKNFNSLSWGECLKLITHIYFYRNFNIYGEHSNTIWSSKFSVTSIGCAFLSVVTMSMYDILIKICTAGAIHFFTHITVINAGM